MINKMVNKIIFGLCLMALTSSCSNDVTGEIFLDKNGNNKQDDGEPYIANLAFTATLNQKDLDLDELQTGSDGSFTFEADGTGTYCVEISSSDLGQVNSDGSEPSVVQLRREGLVSTSSNVLGLAAAAGLPVLSAEADCSNNIDDDADGVSDCDDSDCDGNNSCLTETETSCSNDVDDDGDGDIDCDDSDCNDNSLCDEDDDSSETKATVESGKACDESTGFGVELKVPVAMDYATGIESLDDPATYTVSRGDEITLEIVYPDSCTFDLIFIPTSIVPDNIPTGAYDETTGQLNLNTVAAAATVATSNPLSVEQDPLSNFEMDFLVDQDGSLESTTIRLTPSVTCPDDSVVNLQTQTINIDSADDFDITQSVAGSTTLGSTLTVTTTITNNTSVSYTTEEVTLELVAPTLTSNQSYDSSCSDLGETAQCSFEIGADETVVLVTRFDMPDAISNDTTFEMSATLLLESAGSSATFEGDVISFSIAGDGTGD